MIGFGQFGRKQVEVDIRDLLVEINLSDEDYKDVLEYSSSKESVKAFIEAVKEVKTEKLKPFWIPKIDPSENDGKVIYKKGLKPAVGHSYNWWKYQAKQMKPIDDKTWDVCSEYQRYAFLLYLINQLVKSGWEIGKAIEAMVIDSRDLGHYGNSDNALHDLEPTGSRMIAGFCDLANTYKILKCTNDEVDGFWLAGGSCNCNSYDDPLADLGHNCEVDYFSRYSVGVLVLS